MRHKLARLTPLFAVAMFCSAAWLLWHELERYHWHDIRLSLQAIPVIQVGLCLALTILNYLILVGYDVLAIRAIRHPLPLRRVAFANIWLGAGQDEFSIDLMRYDPAGPAGLMDFLFTELALWGQGEGYQWFNLGMAPLSGIDDRPLASLKNRAIGLIYRHGDHFYHFTGLREYKDKFDPVWHPKYLASPGGLDLPHIVADVANLIGRTRRPASSDPANPKDHCP